MLRGDVLGLGFRTLMVSRLDGPGYEIIKGIIDKALTAEETGLKGIAYIDSRGFNQRICTAILTNLCGIWRRL